MKTLVKVLIVLGFGASLAGCVVAPYGYGRPRAYVAAPVVVFHPCCERRWKCGVRVARPGFRPRDLQSTGEYACQPTSTVRAEKSKLR
jgi:hypothetical protein